MYAMRPRTFRSVDAHVLSPAVGLIRKPRETPSERAVIPGKVELVAQCCLKGVVAFRPEV